MASHSLPDRQCITFLTDFGTRDSYVGQMKGVALSINPRIHLVDLTHEIPSQQVLQGAYAWYDAMSAFPAGTIHVGVVDPGVGSERRIVAAEIGDQCFVCPDNGLLTVILQHASLRRAVSLDKTEWWRSSVSKTFHGRDIMTPVAAAWSLGRDLSELGSAMTQPLATLPLAEVSRGRTSLSGIVINADRFGNLITNIRWQDLPSPESCGLSFEIGAYRIEGIANCYADAEPGEPLVLIGSSGRLEVAIRNGSAADELQAESGRRVVVRWSGSGT